MTRYGLRKAHRIAGTHVVRPRLLTGRKKNKLWFLNGSQKDVIFVVLPTSFPASAVITLATLVTTGKTQYPHVQILPLSRRSKEEAPTTIDDMVQIECLLPEGRESEARVALLTVEIETVSLWFSTIVSGGSQVVVFPRQFAEGMSPLKIRQRLPEDAQVGTTEGPISEVEHLARRLLDTTQESLGQDNLDVAALLSNLAGVLEGQAQGNNDEVIPLYKKSLAIREKELGAQHPDVADSLKSLGELWMVQGNYVKAEELLGQSLKIRERMLGSNHPDVARSLSSMGECLMKMEKYEQARDAYGRALAIDTLAFGPQDTRVAADSTDLARVSASLGENDDAERLFKQSFNIREGLDPEHPDVIASLDDLADTLAAQGKHDDVDRLFRRLHAMRAASSIDEADNGQAVEETSSCTPGQKKIDVLSELHESTQVESPPTIGGHRMASTTNDETKSSDEEALHEMLTTTETGSMARPISPGKRAKPSGGNGTTPDTVLHIAAKDGDVVLVEELLSRECGWEDRKEEDQKLLEDLVDSREQRATEPSSFHPDHRGQGDMTPLHYAVQYRRRPVVQLLLRYGADPDLRNSSGLSALHMACAIDSPTMVSVLLDWGADTCIPDNKGMSPRHFNATNDPEVNHLLNAAQEDMVEDTQVLAPRLRSKAEVFESATHGVEFELQEGSLDVEVPGRVMVTSRGRTVQCSTERDTSRTHAELKARALSGSSGSKTFLAMPIVHGTSNVKFSNEFPAKLRFFAGFLEDYTDDEGEEGSDEVVAAQVGELLTRLPNKYKPAISPDGTFWAMREPFEIVVRQRRDLPTEVWLETKVYHFTHFAVLNNDPGFNFDAPECEFYEGAMPTNLHSQRKRYGIFHKRTACAEILVGNASFREYAYFYVMKDVTPTSLETNTERGANVDVGGNGAGLTKGKLRGSTMESRHTNDVFRHDFRSHEIRKVNLPIDGDFVHRAATLALVFAEEPALASTPAGLPMALPKPYFVQKWQMCENDMLILTDKKFANDWDRRGHAWQTLTSIDAQVVLHELTCTTPKTCLQCTAPPHGSVSPSSTPP